MKQKFFFWSAYDLPPSPGYESDLPSLTIQSARDEADINAIMARYAKTGVISPDVISRRAGVFADVGKFGDYGTLLDAVCSVQEEFDALNPEIREKFNNSPEELINWLQDSDNYDEAVRYGLVVKHPSTVDSGQNTAIKNTETTPSTKTESPTQSEQKY